VLSDVDEASLPLRVAGSILPAMVHGLIGSASAIKPLARTQENKITMPRPHCIQGGNPLFHEILKILLRLKKNSKVAAQGPTLTQMRQWRYESKLPILQDCVI
jgi:hypothetical protein